MHDGQGLIAGGEFSGQIWVGEETEEGYGRRETEPDRIGPLRCTEWAVG